MLEYTLTVADLTAFAAWRDQASGELAQRQGRQRIAGAWLVGVAGYLVVSALLTIPFLLNRDLPLAALGEVAALAAGLSCGWWEWRQGRVAAWLLSRPYVRKAKESLERTGGERRLWLDADGLHVAVGERAEMTPLAAIERVVTTDQHVFIFTGPTAAHVVPRRLGAPLDALVAQLGAGSAS